MIEEIGSYEAKTKLPEILRRVEAGETVTITNRGRPVADLIPSQFSEQHTVEVAIANLVKAKKHKVSGEELKELQENGRK